MAILSASGVLLVGFLRRYKAPASSPGIAAAISVHTIPVEPSPAS
jgi:hypothetical protein